MLWSLRNISTIEIKFIYNLLSNVSIIFHWFEWKFKIPIHSILSIFNNQKTLFNLMWSFKKFNIIDLINSFLSPFFFFLSWRKKGKIKLNLKRLPNFSKFYEKFYWEEQKGKNWCLHNFKEKSGKVQQSGNDGTRRWLKMAE